MRARLRSARIVTSTRSIDGSRDRRSSNAARPTMSVAPRSSDTTVAERRSLAVSRASSPNTSPGPNRLTAMTSPRVDEPRATKTPWVTKWTASPGSPSWHTTSPGAKRRRTPACRSALRSRGATASSTGTTSPHAGP